EPARASRLHIAVSSRGIRPVLMSLVQLCKSKRRQRYTEARIGTGGGRANGRSHAGSDSPLHVRSVHRRLPWISRTERIRVRLSPGVCMAGGGEARWTTPPTRGAR